MHIDAPDRTRAMVTVLARVCQTPQKTYLQRKVRPLLFVYGNRIFHFLPRKSTSEPPLPRPTTPSIPSTPSTIPPCITAPNALARTTGVEIARLVLRLGDLGRRIALAVKDVSS